MARILFGPLVTAVKGSIGGTTFQGNPSGQIIRSRPHTSKSSTSKQQSTHQSVNLFLSSWFNLTQTVRNEWNDYAALWPKINKFGQSKILTGWNWYFSVNFWRNAIGVDWFVSPPPHLVPVDVPSFEIISSDTALKISINPSHDFVTYPVIIYSTIPTRKNTLSINQVRKMIQIITSFPSNPLNITSAWETATQLTWDPATSFPSANVFVCLQVFHKNSGITSSMLCTKTSVENGSSDIFFYYA